MDKPACNKPAVLKISRSVTRIGRLQTLGPFPRPKKPPTSTTSKISVPVQKQGPSNDQASTSPKPVQKPVRKTSIPASSDRPSTNSDLIRTPEPIPKTSIPFSSTGVSPNIRALQTLCPVPKSKIPVSSGYGNQGSASRKQGPLQTKGSAFSGRTSITPGRVQTRRPPPKNNIPVYSDQSFTGFIPVQTPGLQDSEPKSDETFIICASVQDLGPVPKDDEPVFSDQASRSPRSVQSPRCPKSGPVSSDRLSASPGPLQTGAPIPKTKIPILSKSKFRGSTSTSPSPAHSPVLKAKKPIVTSRAFGSTYSVQTRGDKASEPNRGSASRYSGPVKTQGPVLSTRTPTSPDILQNRRPRAKAGESVSTVIRNRGSLSASPSYIRIAKPSDQASAGLKSLQTKKGPIARKPVSSVSKTLQTRGPLPKSNELKSPVSTYSRRASTSSGSVSLGLESPGHVSSKRAPASPVPAKTPVPKSNKSVALANGTQNSAISRPGILRTTRSRIPIREVTRSDQTSSSLPEPPSPSRSPDRKSQMAPKTGLAFQTKLAEELDKRNRSINELEMQLVQNQNLASEQALRLAESKAVQRAKDVVLEQLKSELSTAKEEYDRMHLLLKKADLGLEQATCKVNKYLERSTSMEEELKEARDKIGNLQRQLKDADTKAEIHCQTNDQLRKDVERMQEQLALDSKIIQNLQQSENDLKGDLEKRNKLITQINIELATRDEEFRNLFETLKNEHAQKRSQKLTIKRLEERNKRVEDQNAALLEENKRLKNDLRHYSQMIIANDGKPFFEQVPPGIADRLVPSPEEESQHKRKPKRREM